MYKRQDVFCALTNADEVNIISSMLAKRLGARKVMALINRAAYVDLVQSNTIDIAISAGFRAPMSNPAGPATRLRSVTPRYASQSA